MKCIACLTAEATVKAMFTRADGSTTTMTLCPGCEQLHTLHIPQGDTISITVNPINGGK